MRLIEIHEELRDRLGTLTFGPPVTHVYNPLVYAWGPYRRYLERYGRGPKEVVFLGMNPGPWGMAQTGVPFGEVDAVREWLGIDGPVDTPSREHAKRPVLGFACPRHEVSGRRLWGWARARFATPERFFRRFFVANYCPLLFLEATGRNRTPDRLPPRERDPLLRLCDRALVQTVAALAPRLVVGVGRWAETRARRALAGTAIQVGRVTHPSPANPRANRGWEPLVEEELAALGVEL
ncbi:MAG: single-stranded DNA-binding protein [Deferrisomatales bacterium]